jgi:hypothetical protein
LVDGFRRLEARGISEGVKGTGVAGGEDKEQRWPFDLADEVAARRDRPKAVQRCGTAAALTPKRRALHEQPPLT